MSTRLSGPSFRRCVMCDVCTKARHLPQAEALKLIAQAMQQRGAALGLSPFSLEKLTTVFDAGLRSIELAERAGVRIGLGTDLLGDLHDHQSDELTIRARVQSPLTVLRSATLVNAEILGQRGRLGVIAPGAIADLIAVQGDPLADLTLLQDQGRHLDLIVKDGEIHKLVL